MSLVSRSYNLLVLYLLPPNPCVPHLSPIAGSFNLLVLYDLDPVPIGIKYERHVLHSPVREPLLPVHVQLLEPLASRVEIVHGGAFQKYKCTSQQPG